MDLFRPLDLDARLFSDGTAPERRFESALTCASSSTSEMHAFPA